MSKDLNLNNIEGQIKDILILSYLISKLVSEFMENNFFNKYFNFSYLLL